MEVILKKTKITNSILRQTLIAESNSLKTAFEVIGWCIEIGKAYKWIVLYKSDTNELRKYLMPKLIVPEYDNYNKKHTVRVEFSGNVTHHIYIVDDEIESKRFAEKLTSIKHQAESKGQFFL